MQESPSRAGMFSDSSPGGRFIRNGITLLSGVDPESRCERIADAVSVRERTLFFCPSPLYGYGLDRFCSRLEKEAPSSAVLCIEADPELYELAIKHITSLSLSGGKLRVTNITDTQALYSFVRDTWGARAFRRIEMLKLTGGWQLFPEIYNSLHEALKCEVATDWGNAMTLAKLGRLYIRNMFKNLCLLQRFSFITDISFGETPVLVLGAGPSLDQILDALTLHFSKSLYSPCDRPFRIVCADTCLGSLKDRNIKPDLVVILESQHWNLRDFTGCKGWDVKCAVDFSALPQSADVLALNGFIFFTPWTNLSVFERMKSLGLLPSFMPPLGSVGLTSVELARRVSRGKIICAGLDFSFSEDSYHARSTPGHKNFINMQNRFKGIVNAAAFAHGAYRAVSKTGTTVYSSPVMRRYRDLFEQEFGNDSRIFDIEGSGLPLGVKTLSREKACEYLSQRQECAECAPESGGRENLSLSAITNFRITEKKRLEELKSILSGETAPGKERLKTLIDECDYLWAHFPDYSGGLRPELDEDKSGALSFLKRVRAEIDPMIRTLDFSLKDIF